MNVQFNVLNFFYSTFAYVFILFTFFEHFNVFNFNFTAKSSVYLKQYSISRVKRLMVGNIIKGNISSRQSAACHFRAAGHESCHDVYRQRLNLCLSV